MYSRVIDVSELTFESDLTSKAVLEAGIAIEINELPMRMMPQLSRGSPLVRERTLHNLTGRHATDEAGKKLKGESLSGFLSFRRNRRAR